MSLLSRRSIRCPRCEYELRGVGLPTCPECGLALSKASLAHPDLRAGHWSRDAFLIVLALLTVATAILLAAFVAGFLSAPSSRAFWKPASMVLLTAALLGIELWTLHQGLFRARALWDRPGAVSRRMLAGGVLMVAIVVVGVI